MCLSESQKKQLSGLLAYLFTLLLFEVRDGEVVLRLDLIGERGEEVLARTTCRVSESDDLFLFSFAEHNRLVKVALFFCEFAQ